MDNANRRFEPHFNPRAPRGARLHGAVDQHRRDEFQSTRPSRGATLSAFCLNLCVDISIHAPLAGRDLLSHGRRPVKGISIHAPLAGRDFINKPGYDIPFDISIHAPLAGRDSALML